MDDTALLELIHAGGDDPTPAFVHDLRVALEDELAGRTPVRVEGAARPDRSLGDRPRRGWVALGLLAAAALVGTLIVVVTRPEWSPHDLVPATTVETPATSAVPTTGEVSPTTVDTSTSELPTNPSVPVTADPVTSVEADVVIDVDTPTYEPIVTTLAALPVLFPILHFRPDGTLLAADAMSGRVTVVDPDGTVRIDTTLPPMSDAVLGPDDVVYAVGSLEPGRVAGRFTAYALTGPRAGEALATGPAAEHCTSDCDRLDLGQTSVRRGNGPDVFPFVDPQTGEPSGATLDLPARPAFGDLRVESMDGADLGPNTMAVARATVTGTDGTRTVALPGLVMDGDSYLAPLSQGDGSTLLASRVRRLLDRASPVDESRLVRLLPDGSALVLRTSGLWSNAFVAVGNSILAVSVNGDAFSLVRLDLPAGSPGPTELSLRADGLDLDPTVIHPADDLVPLALRGDGTTAFFAARLTAGGADLVIVDGDAVADTGIVLAGTDAGVLVNDADQLLVTEYRYDQATNAEISTLRAFDPEGGGRWAERGEPMVFTSKTDCALGVSDAGSCRTADEAVPPSFFDLGATPVVRADSSLQTVRSVDGQVTRTWAIDLLVEGRNDCTGDSCERAFDPGPAGTVVFAGAYGDPDGGRQSVFVLNDEHRAAGAWTSDRNNLFLGVAGDQLVAVTHEGVVQAYDLTPLIAAAAATPAAVNAGAIDVWSTADDEPLRPGTEIFASRTTEPELLQFSVMASGRVFQTEPEAEATWEIVDGERHATTIPGGGRLFSGPDERVYRWAEGLLVASRVGTSGAWVVDGESRTAAPCDRFTVLGATLRCADATLEVPQPREAFEALPVLDVTRGGLVTLSSPIADESWQLALGSGTCTIDCGEHLRLVGDDAALWVGAADGFQTHLTVLRPDGTGRSFTVWCDGCTIEVAGTTMYVAGPTMQIPGQATYRIETFDLTPYLAD